MARRNSERGLAGLTVLWILMALSLVSTSAVGLAQQRRRQARNDLAEAKAVIDIFQRLKKGAENNFQDFETADEHGWIRVTCQARAGAADKKVETGWKKWGNDWRVLYWRELN